MFPFFYQVHVNATSSIDIYSLCIMLVGVSVRICIKC